MKKSRSSFVVLGIMSLVCFLGPAVPAAAGVVAYTVSAWQPGPVDDDLTFGGGGVLFSDGSANVTFGDSDLVDGVVEIKLWTITEWFPGEEGFVAICIESVVLPDGATFNFCDFGPPIPIEIGRAVPSVMNPTVFMRVTPVE